jgi:hypothetical protein
MARNEVRTGDYSFQETKIGLDYRVKAFIAFCCCFIVTLQIVVGLVLFEITKMAPLEVGFNSMAVRSDISAFGYSNPMILQRLRLTIFSASSMRLDVYSLDDNFLSFPAFISEWTLRLLSVVDIKTSGKLIRYIKEKPPTFCSVRTQQKHDSRLFAK